MGDGLPSATSLGQNIPNPFNPSTKIGFALKESGPVTLVIHDVAGRLVRTLLAGEVLGAGAHGVVWDGRDLKDRPAAAGVYFYTVRTDSFEDTKPMTLVK